jgi:hypothetical protein
VLRGLFVAGAIGLGIAGIAACGSNHPAPNASASNSTSPPSTSKVSALQSTSTSPAPTSSPACVGLSICPPPPPDAEGNPACYYADGWRADSSGAGIEVWYFHEPEKMSTPDRVTATVRMKDGTNQSQDANIDAGQQVHRFEFPTTKQSSVDEVLFTSSGGRCFVIGPS